MESKKPMYKDCEHIERKPPDEEKPSQEIIDRIGRSYRTIPAFEKTLYEIKSVEHYSFRNNELLRCRWKQYRKHAADIVFTPFDFLDHRDFHIHRSSVQLAPQFSTHRPLNFKHKMRVGPGIDCKGQLPIPNESFMKRGAAKKPDKKIKGKINTAIKEKIKENESEITEEKK